MTAGRNASEPTTGSVAIAEVHADLTETDPQPDEDQLAHSDNLLDAIAGVERDIADQLPPGLWKAITKYDRSRLVAPADLPDLQIDAWDVESARAIAKHLPWAEGLVQEHVIPGKGYDFYVWDGLFGGFRVRVMGPQELPTAVPRWWSKVECNDTPGGAA